MFDFVQNNKVVQLGMKVLLGAIALSFVGIASYSYDFMGGGANEVAKVGDKSITRQEVDFALQQRNLGQDKAEQMTQELVQRQMLLEKAAELGVRVTDAELAKAIAQVPVFQKDGKFSYDLYQEYLTNNRTSGTAFESRFREDLVYERMRELTSNMFSGGFYAKSTNATLAQFLAREREVSSARIDASAFMDKVQVGEQDVAAYYKAHPAEFQQPEKVRVEYLLLSVPVLAMTQTVNEDEIKSFFDKNKTQFERDERKTSHILLTVPAKADAAGKQAVKAKAEQLLQQVRSNPARFAELAKQNSQDPGSAAQGGELGWLSREGLDQTFADALFAMSNTGISDLVESQFGFHIIQLSAIRRTGLEEARATITEKLKEQKARKAFPAVTDELSELVINSEKNLAPVAQKVKLTLQTTDWFTRAGQENDPVFSSKNKDVLERIFSSDGLAGRATEIIELPDQQRLVARVVERKPARLPPLTEVAAAIRSKLQDQGAAKLAEAEGKRLLQALQKGETLPLKWSETQKVGLMQGGMLSQDAVKQLMAAPEGANVFSGIVERNGYTLFKVGPFSKTPPDPRLAEQLEKQRLMGEAEAYDKLLRRELLTRPPVAAEPAGNS